MRVFRVPKYFKRVFSVCLAFIFITTAFAFCDIEHKYKPKKSHISSRKKKNSVCITQVNIDDNLMNALILVESSNNLRAYQRRTGARGLTQVRRRAWKDLVRHYPRKYKNLNYKKDIFEPDVARDAGRDYLEVLRHYLNKERIPVTLENLLAAYNWGIKNLSRHGLERAPLETRDYIRKIKTLL